MSAHQMESHVLDARPDRIDFRDRPFNPRLVSLPESHPSEHLISTFLSLYHETGKILDQGREGACTGFGLAAVINYMTWDHWMRSHGGRPPADAKLPPHVSPWMLYDNARVYDEWEGEDYSGSSCRGAMKGWHKHGVCNEQLWPKRGRSSKRPNPSWQSDAERRPLGAYYRVDARSIADMQAAVHEVNAVYCSARVHEGWLLDRARYSVTVADHPLPVISARSFEDITGGHAFAVVGYTEDGFIIQNSWGRDWGHQGFGLLTYEDWMRNGDDAWVAAMAARAKLSSSVSSEIPASYSQTQMQLSVSMEALKDDRTRGPGKPWREAKAYEHAVVMGNDGKLLRRLIDTADSADNLEKVVLETPSRAIEKGAKHVMIYAHGGLNSERAAIERAMRMGPWFEANGIHPVFVVWRTSLLESIGQIGQDFVQTFQKERDELKAESVGDVLDRMIEKLQNKFDKAFEAAAEKVVGKAVWSQMKQNARQAATGKGGSRRIVRALRLLKDRHPGMRLHLVGHSAGSILLGHMLGDMDKALGVDTVSLFAPACSVDFAVTHYGRALNAGTIGKGKLHVDNLSDKNERRDTVGPYGKSLLYLVSRAFEDPYKMPLLGFARSWADVKVELRELMRERGADFAESGIRAMHKWATIADQFGVALKVLQDREVETYRANGDRVQIKAAHGSFDNDLAVMNAALRRMLGGAAPEHEIQDLRGF